MKKTPKVKKTFLPVELLSRRPLSRNSRSSEATASHTDVLSWHYCCLEPTASTLVPAQAFMQASAAFTAFHLAWHPELILCLLQGKKRHGARLAVGRPEWCDSSFDFCLLKMHT